MGYVSISKKKMTYKENTTVATGNWKFNLTKQQPHKQKKKSIWE